MNPFLLKPISFEVPYLFFSGGWGVGLDLLGEIGLVGAGRGGLGGLYD